MRGNTFGKLFSLTTFGESHGEALGVVLDGVPANLIFSLDDLQKELDRRAPGKIEGTTTRKEADKAEVLSGIFSGKTLGSPISIIVRNTNQKSGDYEAWKDDPRPGHADQTTMAKFGIRDHRGGGRSSGRETLSRVIGGYFAGLIIPTVVVKANITKLGPFSGTVELNDEVKTYLKKLQAEGDSVGGKVTVTVQNLQAGLGEPAFDKLKADLAKAMLSIGAVVGFSYGLGEEFAYKTGKEISASRKNFGGMEGGISNGEDLLFHVIFKPTSTVGDKATSGRHDPCIIPRALPVVEAMTKIVLADHFLRQRAYE
jgi:chorismate synthase